MGSNDLISNFMSVLILPLGIVSICLFSPLIFLFKFMNTIYRRCLSIENLAGKVVLITGASSGIGEQLAYEYAKKGAYLIIVARRESKLQKVAEVARELGSLDVLPICADVSNIKDCKRFIDEAINHFGRLDHLVNNAGIGSICSFEDAGDVTKFLPLMDVNFWGSIYPTYYAIPHLKKTRGKIVVNSSAAAVLRPPRLSFYAASKSALLSFYESLRIELSPAITITTITLGVIESEMSRGKLLFKNGVLRTDRKLTYNLYKGLPVMSSGACAEAIVRAVRRGERNVTEPKWYMVFLLLNTLWPELRDWIYRNFYFKPRI